MWDLAAKKILIQPQKMSALKILLKTTHTFLNSSPVFSSFPLSVLLIGVEKLAELNLSCPCSSWNKELIVLMFIGPSLFICALMFVLLTPFRYICYKHSADEHFCDRLKSCCKCTHKEDICKCLKAFVHCLIPSIMWVIFLFLDGDYLACYNTDWVGDYVFNEKLNRKWCQPSELAYAGNENDYHQKYQAFVSNSRVVGYRMLAVFGFLIILIIGFCDCYKGTPPRTEESVETGMRTGVELHTEDPQGRRGDVQTGAHSSAQDPQGGEEDICLVQEGSSEL